MKLRDLSAEAERLASRRFTEIDRIAERNTAKVLSAFRAHRVSDAMFAGSSGYGYDDLGRETLEKVFADVFGAESALVRVQFVNGTHAIACALFAALAPGELMVSVTGKPYDTLLGVIGKSGSDWGSLAFYGIKYAEGRERVPDAKVAYIQRSRGYTERKALSVGEIGEMIRGIREVNPNAVIIVDNCYGEFTEEFEPTAVGADLCAGSLIKNPGGGLAPCGGYVVGRSELVNRAAERLSVPGIGGECGATLGQNKPLFQGLFSAPHVTAQALKTAVFASALFQLMGYKTSPDCDEPRYDIIQTIELGSAELVTRFCGGIQRGSPVDSFAAPEPWAMPGYDCDVIMAAGAFTQGASIELSADAPMREPYRVYIQGGLTYESGKLGII
ncbi:MAG: methionine gamma-lyase family protein [Oscillospiraceae bacterium]|jgi:cystathionine beta-lyase family protein involved in aluminum resistance|nr:methionine gamma-lyase family protein [Oscillospiraceae bacterium]